MNLKPTKNLAASDDPANIDLALTVLCFMGKHGPTGLLLKYIREYFQFHSDQSAASRSLLVRKLYLADTCGYSYLISRTTNVMSQAIEQWITMRDQKRNNPITESRDRAYASAFIRHYLIARKRFVIPVVIISWLC